MSYNSNEVLNNIPNTESLNLDKDREQYYDDWVASLTALDYQEIKTHFMDCFMSLKRGSVLMLNDIEGLELEVLDNQSMSGLGKLTGYEFKRPIFTLPLPQLLKLRNQLSGERSNVSRGFAVSKSFFDPLSGLGSFYNTDYFGPTLVVAPQDNFSLNISHELIHTLDSYIDKRKEANTLLTEFGAYYFHTYVPIPVETVTEQDGKVTTNREEILHNLNFIRSHLLAEGGFQIYGKGFTLESSYNQTVNTLTSLLQQLEKTDLTKVQINRAILNSSSIENLQTLLSVYSK